MQVKCIIFMLDSNQTLNIIINPGKLLPAQKFSKE
jgi:hypothetical protein